jgi:hypothetical protein
MKQSINFSQFCDAFHNMGREDQFSYQGKKALFEYLEQLSEDCDTEIELDVIALCCEYSEYEDLKEIQEDYSDIEDLRDLQDHTQVIEFNHGSLIIASY